MVTALPVYDLLNSNRIKDKNNYTNKLKSNSMNGDFINYSNIIEDRIKKNEAGQISVFTPKTAYERANLFNNQKQPILLKDYELKQVIQNIKKSRYALDRNKNLNSQKYFLAYIDVENLIGRTAEVNVASKKSNPILFNDGGQIMKAALSEYYKHARENTRNYQDNQLDILVG